MATHNNLGNIGEGIALRYLSEHGYNILETNWKLNHLEADIIATKDNFIVLVEVKTRRCNVFGNPEDFIDFKKKRACITLLNSYIQMHQRTEEARIDVLSVVLNEHGMNLELIPNAFGPSNVGSRR